MDRQENQITENASAKAKETEIVKHALRNTYNSLNEKMLRQVTREVAFAPQNRKIEVGGQKTTVSDLRYQLAHTIENLGSQKTLDEAKDLQYMTAHSIEAMNSETSSSQEYFRWLDETTEILKHMNDGFVTKEDLDERNEFLDSSHQREAELMVCLALYESSKHPDAQEQVKKMRYKLMKLREMRSAIENRTRNQADVEISRAEYDMVIPHYKVFKSFQKLPFGYDITHQQKIMLDISHDDDDDLAEDFSYHEHLLNVILDQMKEEDARYIAQEYQLAYDLANEDIIAKKQETSDKLKELSGRKNSFRLKYDILNSRISGR